jgi:hypothetical protein
MHAAAAPPPGTDASAAVLGQTASPAARLVLDASAERWAVQRTAARALRGLAYGRNLPSGPPPSEGLAQLLSPLRGCDAAEEEVLRALTTRLQLTQARACRLATRRARAGDARRRAAACSLRRRRRDI